MMTTHTREKIEKIEEKDIDRLELEARKKYKTIFAIDSVFQSNLIILTINKLNQVIDRLNQIEEERKG